MRVPSVVVDLDAVPKQVPGHIDKTHAGLDEPAGDQRAVTEQSPAIAFQQARVFFLEIERGLHLRRSEQVERAFLRPAKRSQ